MRIVAKRRGNNRYHKPLVRKLVSFNDRNGPPEDWEYVGFYALDEKNRLIGGVQGNFEWDWLHILHLWVKESGKGTGSKLMRRMETLAKKKNKTGIFLDTLAFQARPFYEKFGFTVMGTIDRAAGPHTRYFMVKHLR
ncbi:MAG: GNAT family N-acetyltransferase [Alphaproteobacteria bacterium]|nr:GNAT family N-acetyltransferase [Alphaproteobacteria bacterium]